MSGIPAGAGALLGKRLGKYEILALLALGGTAEIYLARIDGTNGFEKYVVIKCLHDHLVDDPDFVKMFLDEARLAALLDHSNIVQTFELGEHENRYYMVMEFLAGLSLAMVVRRAAERLPGGRLPAQLALNACAQACAGLHYSHERTSSGRALNIVHRDISPQNLVVSFEGVVKVVDYGIAKAEMRETRTRSGTIKGKFAYMSPEQCVANNVDRRTDVFALGVILHELLTGRRLFKRPSPYDTYQAVIECNVAPPSQLNHELDPALDPIVMDALAKDKEQRYETAEAFGDALLGYLHHRGKGSGAGEISRFFDTHFTQELEEHSTRMRELIAGREMAVDTGVSWDKDMAELEAGNGGGEGAGEAAAAATRGGPPIVISGELGEPAEKPQPAADSPVTAEAGNARAAASGEIELPGGVRPSGLTSILSDLDDGGDRTRIEENPLGIAPTLQPGVLSVADIGDWVGDMSSYSEAQPLGSAKPSPPLGRGSASISINAPTMLAGAPLDLERVDPEMAPTQIAPAVEVSRPSLAGPPAYGGPQGGASAALSNSLGASAGPAASSGSLPGMQPMGGPAPEQSGPMGPMGTHGGMGPGPNGGPMSTNGAMGPNGIGPGGPNGPIGPGGPMMGPGGPMMGPGGPMMGHGGPMGMGPGRPMGMGPGRPMGMGPGGPMGMGPGGPMGMGPGGPMGMGPGGPMGMGPGGPMGMGRHQQGPAGGGLGMSFNRIIATSPWWLLALMFVAVVGLALGLTLAVAKAF
jgi:serine/threonine-protein kinase